MICVLLRHGEKTFQKDDGNNPLSHLGLIQAQKLKDLVKKGLLPKPNRLMSSPIPRCVETLRPLSEEMKISIENEDLLRLRLPHEDLISWQERLTKVQNLIQAESFKNPEQVLYICSHQDWLPYVTKKLIPSFTPPLPWPTALYVVIIQKENQWRVQALGRLE